MVRVFALGLLTSLLVAGPARPADDDEDGPVTARQALQALNDFIGDWKGSGSPEKARPGPRDSWREKVSWSWRFKGDDAWLVMKVEDGKYLEGGELHYLPAKKLYELRAKTADGKKVVYTGQVKKEVLTLSRKDPESKETQRLLMNVAGDGVRFVYRFEYRPPGRTVFYRAYQVGCTKEGESLGAAEKKIECVVSGGLGKIPVSYNGQTYYVCCSGCLEAFKENPAKYVKEYEAKKAKKKGDE